MIAFWLLLSLPTVQLEPGGPGCASGAALMTALDSALTAEMVRHHVPGAALAVVVDGETRILRGYGCADLEQAIPVDAERTVFRIGSVSKLFVATAALQLVAAGRLDLHTDINGALGTMHVPEVFGQPITLHQLLTHTAGLDERVVGYAARTPDDLEPLADFLGRRLPARGWAPGIHTGYSNFGYALAGLAIETVASSSFADHVARSILDPLGMTRSSYGQPAPAELRAHAAIGYRCDTLGCTQLPVDYRSAYPPGGLVSTASDMSRFILANLGRDPATASVLNARARALMHAQQFTHHAALPGMAYGFAEEQVHGWRALSHAGGIPGFSSALMLIPESGFGVFLATNGGSSAFGRAALEIVEAALVDAASAQDSAPRRSPPSSMIDPTGWYRLTRYAHFTVENLPMLFTGQLHVARAAGDTLVVSGLGEADGSYIPVGSDLWRNVHAPDLIAVRTDTDGNVTHLFGSKSFFGTRFPSAFERLPWYDAPPFVNESLTLLVIAWPLLALWLLIAGVRYARRRLRGKPPQERHRPLAPVLAALGFAVLATWFGFGFIAETVRAAERGGGEVVYGMPAVMAVLARVPWVLAALAVVIAMSSLRSWRRRWWSLAGRVCFSLIALSTLLLLALLAHWSYLPARY
jgi:CubicO group peptidase (beta-lactamase class C family)